MRENNRTKIIIYSIIIAIVMCTAIITLGIILSRKSSQKMTPKQDSTNQQTNSTSINNSDTDIKDDEANYIYQDVVLLSSTETDIVSSLAQINNNIKIKNTTVELSNLGEIVDSDHSEELVNTFLTLRGYTSMEEFIASLNFNSQTANNPNGAAGKVFVESSTNSQDGIIIFMTENHEMNGPRIKDLTVGE